MDYEVISFQNVAQSDLWRLNRFLIGPNQEMCIQPILVSENLRIDDRFNLFILYDVEL